MGKFGVIRSIGGWVLGPVYGWMVDKYSAFLPTLLSAGVCATGCCLRGFTPVGRIELLYAAAVVLGLGAASFWNVVGTHVACATPTDMRSLVVSAFYVQLELSNAAALGLGKQSFCFAPFFRFGTPVVGMGVPLARASPGVPFLIHWICQAPLR